MSPRTPASGEIFSTPAPFLAEFGAGGIENNQYDLH
jgi:hypothetical protein